MQYRQSCCTQHGPKTLIHLVVLLSVFMMLLMMNQGKLLPLIQFQMTTFVQPLLKALLLRRLLSEASVV
jgi:hypothetical protein